MVPKKPALFTVTFRGFSGMVFGSPCFHRGGRGCACVPAGSAPLDFILVLQEGGQVVWDDVVTMIGSEVLDS